VRDRTGVHIGEAFMFARPAMDRARGIVRSVRLRARAIQAVFSYFHRDAANIRNVREWGGGALMNRCYPIQIGPVFIRTGAGARGGAAGA